MKYTNRMTIDQAVGGVVNEVNVHREDIKDKTIEAIEKALFERNRIQDQNFINAIQEIGSVRDFLGDPSKILGSQMTKHGEIAEHVEVGIGNAKQLIKGLPKRFSFEGVGRTAPEDYIMDGIKAQSKFINGENNTLSAVIDHLEKYKDINFGRDGSKYVIPKDFFETINKIIKDENVEGLSEKTIQAIKDKVQTIEAMTGKDFNDAVKSSISNYKDVQQGVISKTVDNYEKQISNENTEIRKSLKQDADSKKDAAIIKAQPSVQEALQAAAISAAAEGVIQTAVMMFHKKKALKDYNVEDWKEVGIVFGKGAGKGAIRGSAIYGLTNYAAMPAPLAASFVSASFGVASLYSSYKKGLISSEEMIEQGEILCFDTTLNLLGSTIGQTLIPIPVLGAVIGSIAANVLGGIIKDQLNVREKELIRLSRIRYEENMKLLDEKLAKEIEKIVKHMMFMWGLSRMAFNYKINASLRLEASQRLAVAHGVSADKILMNESEIDDYFIG